MFDILPALLWIVAAVISLNICSITAIRGNIFSKPRVTYIRYAGQLSDYISHR